MRLKAVLIRPASGEFSQLAALFLQTYASVSVRPPGGRPKYNLRHLALVKSISGIRGTLGGVAGDILTPQEIVNNTAAYGYWLARSGQTRKVVIGRDGRISGSLVSGLVTQTLRAVGIDVVDLDYSTTPTVEMAVKMEGAGGGIIITASHNPKEWNALKFLNHEGEFLSQADNDAMQGYLYDNAIEYASVEKLGDHWTDNTYLHKHLAAILELPLVDADAVRAKGFNVVVDCINSTGALAVPPLLDELGVTYVLINETVNGQFQHKPEPLPKNLVQLAKAVTEHKAHLGIAVDPDVDRLAFVSEDGHMFGEEYTLVAIADYVLQHHPGGSTVSNLSSTRALADVTAKHGGTYHASAVGEVNVVVKMKAVDAVIGGEGNGGVIVPGLHYGRDALAGIALFLSHLAKFGKRASYLRKTYPDYYIAKNKINKTDDFDLDRLFAGLKQKYRNEKLNDVDGLKIDLEDGWIHLRNSNTEPIVRIYTESHSPVIANNLYKKISQDITEIMGGQSQDQD